MKTIWYIDSWWKKTLYVIGWIATIFYALAFIVGFIIGFIGAA